MKRTSLSRFRQKLLALGPGIVTGASDDDPSGIATYSQAGAQFGFLSLWTAWFTFPLMANIQGMCARIGMVTGHGLTVTLKNEYPKAILYLTLLFSFPAITLNIGADIQAMGAVAHMLWPFVPVPVFSIIFTALLMFMIIRFPYLCIARILKWLCLSLLLYMIVPFLVTQDWSVVLKHTFLPELHLDENFISILVAILGTTISPYLFFWQATMEAEDRSHRHRRLVVNKRLLSDVRTDVNLGMFLSNLVMYFIILTTASVLNAGGIRDIQTVEQAAQALKPLAGRFSYLVFSIGVLGTGFLAIPVLAGSQSYMLAETFNWQSGLDKKFSKAKPFYITIIVSLTVGLLLHFLQISPIKALLYTAILYGLTSPVLIGVILHVSNNKLIMRKFVNTKTDNVIGVLAFLLMTAAAVALLWLQLKPNI